MRKSILYLLICFTYLACKKEEIIIIKPTATGKINITIDQIINDSTIVLKWNRFTGSDFKKYRLIRTSIYFKNGLLGTYSEPIDSSQDINHLSFIENKMPLSRDVYYDLYVIKDSSQPNAPYGAADRVYYQRPNSLYFGIPRDILIDTLQKRLYISDASSINLIDYTTGRLLISKEFSNTIGYCALGDFAGSKELYVPVNDGWLHILDATNLQLKDRIYIAGDGIGSVAVAQEKIYVSSSDLTKGSGNCLKVYDRPTKALVARTGFRERTRLLTPKGSSVEFIEFTQNIMPIDLSYYQFSPSGVLITKKQDSYHGDHLMSTDIARSFPDGSKFITSSSGTIFDKSLVFERYLNQWGNFSDFEFNTDGSIIYSAYSTQKKIDAIGYPSITTFQTYSTSYYPYRIFRDGNHLICISKTHIHQQMTYLSIEKLTL